MPRILLIVIAVLAALYGGYWVVGSRAVERGALAALDGLEAQGWEVAHDGLSTGGFPSRFDTAVDGLSLRAPGGAGYAAPRVEVMALSYRPGRVIAVWPEGQRIEAGGLSLAVSNAVRASARLDVPGGLALRALTVEGGGEEPLVASDAPAYAVRADRALAALREAGGAPASYDLFGEAAGLRAGDMADPATLVIEATAALDRPLGPGGNGAPRLRSLGIDQASVTAGAGTLDAVGDLAVGLDGTLGGAVTLTVTGWEDLLAAAQAARLIDEGQAVFYGRFLDQAAEGGESVDLPLVIEAGRVTALGLPFGFVPPLPPPQDAP